MPFLLTCPPDHPCCRVVVYSPFRVYYNKRPSHSQVSELRILRRYVELSFEKKKYRHKEIRWFQNGFIAIVVYLNYKYKKTKISSMFLLYTVRQTQSCPNCIPLHKFPYLVKVSTISYSYHIYTRSFSNLSSLRNVRFHRMDG